MRAAPWRRFWRNVVCNRSPICQRGAAFPLTRGATWFMDGYWPSVQFAVDDMPIAWVCESGRVALQGRLWNRGVFR
ncbi:hypothetical protein CQ050_28880 [Achromobacter sp. MYb9]|nr:hypothetical protein CQ050_28880 [Achromobacter sp. MYb9]